MILQHFSFVNHSISIAASNNQSLLSEKIRCRSERIETENNNIYFYEEIPQKVSENDDYLTVFLQNKPFNLKLDA